MDEELIEALDEVEAQLVPRCTSSPQSTQGVGLLLLPAPQTWVSEHPEAPLAAVKAWSL